MVLHSIFSSDYSEQRWVDQITKCFDKEGAMDVAKVPVSVFTVPKSISKFKPEAYIPQVIALGPYHHFRPELYHMERFKLAALKMYLTPDQILDFGYLVIDKLRELEPTIRACYHKYVDMDHDTLAWIIAIDGIFLLHLLQDYADVSCSMRSRMMQSSMLYGDLLVLENQVPVILLRKIRESLRPSISHSAYDDSELFSMLIGFCQVHSPLKLTRNLHKWDDVIHLHLLDLMYHLIVNHREIEKVHPSIHSKVQKEEAHVEIKEENFIYNVGEIVEVGLTFGIGKKALRPVQVIRNMPWDKITTILGLQTISNKHGEENNSLIEEIGIPSVSNLYNYGGVTLSHTIGGIRDIKFVMRDATLYLPVITLNANSEVVLRNLVAYELATSDSTLELTQYVDMMCGMIDTTEDARLLKEKGIIKGELSNEEIAKLFNGINKSTGNDGTNNIIEQINEHYNKRPVVKAYKIVCKRVYDSWKALTVISTIVVILLMLLHSFCQVYGCPRFFGRSD